MRSSLEDGKRLLCKVEFPTCFLVNTLSCFPSGWHWVWDGFSCRANHTSVSRSPWWWGHLPKQNRLICRSWRKPLGICCPQSALMGQPAVQVHLMWPPETFSLLLWLCFPGRIFVSAPTSKPSLPFLLPPSTLLFSSQIFPSFTLPSPYDPSLFQLFSDVTPHSSHPVRMTPAHHHHELSDGWVYLTTSACKPHLQASLQGTDNTVWMLKANISAFLYMNFATLPSPMSHISHQSLEGRNTSPSNESCHNTGTYPTWDAKSSLQAKDTDEPFEHWKQVMLLAFQGNLGKPFSFQLWSQIKKPFPGQYVMWTHGTP